MVSSTWPAPTSKPTTPSASSNWSAPRLTPDLLQHQNPIRFKADGDYLISSSYGFMTPGSIVTAPSILTRTGPISPDGISGESALNFVMFVCVNRLLSGKL